MQSLKSFANQMSSQTTVAVQTLARASHINHAAFAAGRPLQNAVLVSVGYPAKFAGSTSHPNSRGAFAVNDLQSPLGVEICDVFIADVAGADRVNNRYVFGMQHQLWSQPQQNDEYGNADRCQKVEPNVFAFNAVEQNLNNIEGVEQQSSTAPNKVGFWAKSDRVLHESIFAGKSLDRKNHSK